MSIRIEFRELWTYEVSETTVRLPVSSLDSKEGGHIHGRLTITINNRELPYLGYFGKDDVCFNEWCRELHNALEALTAGDPAKYIYDEGEQGQPAFKFEREGDRLFLSIVESLISDAPGHEDWQRVGFSLADFTTAVQGFETSFKKILGAECPKLAEAWLSMVLGKGR